MFCNILKKRLVQNFIITQVFCKVRWFSPNLTHCEKFLKVRNFLRCVAICNQYEMYPIKWLTYTKCILLLERKQDDCLKKVPCKWYGSCFKRTRNLPKWWLWCLLNIQCINFQPCVISTCYISFIHSYFSKITI